MNLLKWRYSTNVIRKIRILDFTSSHKTKQKLNAFTEQNWLQSSLLHTRTQTSTNLEYQSTSARNNIGLCLLRTGKIRKHQQTEWSGEEGRGGENVEGNEIRGKKKERVIWKGGEKSEWKFHERNCSNASWIEAMVKVLLVGQLVHLRRV